MRCNVYWTGRAFVLALSSLTLLLLNGNCHAGNPPNVVLIMADDLGYAELGCYGQQKIETPNIDQLAAEGMRFTHFYAGSAVCAPTRCNLMTGMHGGHAYIRSNSEIGPWDSFLGQSPLPEGTQTIASVLKQAGYATGAFGKWGLGGVRTSGDPLKLGFDRFFGYNCQRHAHNLFPKYLVDNEKKHMLQGNDRSLTGKQYAPQVIADKALDFIRKHRDGPFFLYYPSVLPHLALQAPEKEIAHYLGRWPETPYVGDRYLPHPTPRACYAAMISFHDKQVGRLMELLKQLEIDENTIVLYTSDNGTTMLADQVDYEFFESVGPLRGLKGSLYEGGIRVPLIVRWPGRIQENSHSEHLSAHYDLLDTISEIVRGENRQSGPIVENKDPKNDGISILPTLLGQAGNQKHHDYLFWDFSGYGGQIAVRQGDWKGIKQNLRENANAPMELYNLQQDQGEETNLAQKHPNIATELERILLDARTRPEIESFRFGRYRD